MGRFAGVVCKPLNGSLRAVGDERPTSEVGSGGDNDRGVPLRPLLTRSGHPGHCNLLRKSGNYCRSTVQLTDAQSQGTKVVSKVARDWKTEGISRIFR